MKTQRELLEEHRKKLDERYLQKYPGGKFVVQFVRNDVSLHWVPKRNTSHTSKRGISAFYALQAVHAGPTQGLAIGQIAHRNFQGCSFGKCNNYDSFEKLLAACERQDVPVELVKEFS